MVILPSRRVTSRELLTNVYDRETVSLANGNSPPLRLCSSNSRARPPVLFLSLRRQTKINPFKLTMNPISILIADDHALIRQTWNFILSTHPRYQIIGESATGEQTVALVRQLCPDVVIMDINMPDIDGLEATRRIRQCSPHTRVIGVTSHTQPAYARKMMQNGAMGYVTKSSPASEFFAAIDAVLGGATFICQEIKNNLTEQMFSGSDPMAALNSLSAREREIIDLLKEGWSSAEIGEKLYISEKTVEVHRYNIMKKIKVKNTAALVNYINHHLVC